MMNARYLIMLSLLPALTGCGVNSALPGGPPAPVAQVDQMVVQAAPTAVNWDGRPGADGIDLMVHFFLMAQKQPVTVQGSIEFKLYEGALSAEKLQATPVFQEWRYAGNNLRSALQRTSFGWGYAFRLGWGSHVPQASAVTVVIQYAAPSGKTVTSDPVTIPMTQ